jgi:hypothetical protein
MHNLQHLGDEMRKFLVAGLIAAIGTVAFVSQGHAASRYCIYNPDDPACYDGGGYPPPPDYGNNDGYDGSNIDPPPRPRRHGRHSGYGDNGGYDPFYDDNGYGYDSGPVLSFSFGNNGNRCQNIANSLRRSGFRNVRSVDCAGRDFAYLVRRDGQRLRVAVKSSTGRIIKIQPY